MLRNLEIRVKGYGITFFFLIRRFLETAGSVSPPFPFSAGHTLLFLSHTRTCSLIAVCLIYSTGFKLRGNSAVGKEVMDLKAILRLFCPGSLDSLLFSFFSCFCVCFLNLQ